GKDSFELEAMGIAVGHQDQKRLEIILADFEKQFPEWNDKVADLVWELRPPSVMAKLPAKLSDKSLSVASRARIVDILASSDDKDAGKALLKLLETDLPAEVRKRVIVNLKPLLKTKWKQLGSSPELKETIDKLLLDKRTMAAGFSLIAAAEKTEYIKQVNAVFSDDHGLPHSVQIAAIETLGQLPSPEAVKLLRGKLYHEDDRIIAAGVRALANHIPAYGNAPTTQ